MSESDCARCEARHMTSRDICQRCAEASIGPTEVQREAAEMAAREYREYWLRRLAEAGGDMPW